MKELVGVVAGLVLVAGIVYGGYWVAKNVSYALFYEDMVSETINETVKKNCLIK